MRLSSHRNDDEVDDDDDSDAGMADDRLSSNRLEPCVYVCHPQPICTRASCASCKGCVATMEEFLDMSWDVDVEPADIPVEAEVTAPETRSPSSSPGQPEPSLVIPCLEPQSSSSPPGPLEPIPVIPCSDDPELYNVSPVSPASGTEHVAVAPEPVSFVAADLGISSKAPPPSPSPASGPASSSAPSAPGSSSSASAKASMGRSGYEPWRSGVNGGKQRFGSSGGQHREYFAGLYRSKGKGKESMREFIRLHGPPPRKGQGKGKVDS